MNYLHLIGELEELAGQLNLAIRYEKGDFEGGYCILKEKKILVVNKRLPDPRRASAIAVALAEFGIEQTFVKPTLRAYIEDEAAKLARSQQQR